VDLGLVRLNLCCGRRPLHRQQGAAWLQQGQTPLHQSIQGRDRAGRYPLRRPYGVDDATLFGTPTHDTNGFVETEIGHRLLKELHAPLQRFDQVDA